MSISTRPTTSELRHRTSSLRSLPPAAPTSVFAPSLSPTTSLAPSPPRSCPAVASATMPLWSEIAKSASQPKSPPPAVKASSPPSGTFTLARSPNTTMTTTSPATNGHSSHGPSGAPLPVSSRRFSWSQDVDDEEEFQLARTRAPVVATTPSRDSRSPTTSETPSETIARLNIHILELESLVHGETILNDDSDVMIALRSTLAEKDVQLAFLEKELRDKELQVAQYVGDMDEKDRLIAQLEIEIEEKAAYVQELQSMIQESAKLSDINTDTVAASASEPTEVKNSIESTHHPEAPLTPSKQTSVSPAQTESSMKDAEPVETPSAKSVFSPGDFPVMSSPKSSVGSPVPRYLTETVFAEAATIKKTGPVPPAPKLTMGIDTSKFGKKSPVLKGHRAASPTMPEIRSHIDFRKMSPEERKPFGNGPIVTVKMGPEAIGTVPKAMMMQCSYMAKEHFTNNANASSITFTEPMSKKAAQQHIRWMNELIFSEKVFSVSIDLSGAPGADRYNLEVIRAARVMGLNNIYVGHHTKHYCAKIREEALSHDLMSHIVQVHYPRNDPVFECLANNLVMQRQRRTIPEVASFEKFLEEHKALAAKMDDVEAKNRAIRARKTPFANRNGTGATAGISNRAAA